MESQTETIARLLDLTRAAEKAVETLNEARIAIGLTPLGLEAAQGKDTKAAAPAEQVPDRDEIHIRPAHTTAFQAATRGAPAAEDRGSSEKMRPGVAEATKRDWAVVREAGLKSRGRPSRELVERALKIIARRNGRKQA